MDEDMGNLFRAIDQHYELSKQFKCTWMSLCQNGQLTKRLFKNLTYYVDWMKKEFPQEKIHGVMGKVYDLTDNSVLYPIQKPFDGDPTHDNSEPKRFEAWLMSNIFRYMENPEFGEYEKNHT